MGVLRWGGWPLFGEVTWKVGVVARLLHSSHNLFIMTDLAMTLHDNNNRGNNCAPLLGLLQLYTLVAYMKREAHIVD